MKLPLSLQEDLTRYKPVQILDALLSRKNLSRLRALFFTSTLITGFAYLLTTAFLNVSIPPQLFLGVGLLSFGLWLEQILLYSYHNHFYFHGLNSILGLPGKATTGATYEVAVALKGYESDVTAGFCTSPLGKEILLRSGLRQADIAAFVASSRTVLTSDRIDLIENSIFTLITLCEYILLQDPSFKKFIKEHGVSDDTLRGAAAWIVLAHHHTKKQARWWGRDNLSKITGLGREWSYGTPYLLEMYTTPLTYNAIFRNTASVKNAFKADTITAIEVALAGNQAANVLLIAQDGVGSMDLLAEIADRQKNGVSIGSITEQHMVVLDTARLFALHAEKADLEMLLINLFTEAHNAGNITIVIENISAVIIDAQSHGVHLPELLDQFLASPQLHIIATDTPEAFHATLQRQHGFTRRFTEILLEAPGSETVLHILQSIALQLEREYAVFFAYPALFATATGADRFIVSGAMPEKAILLLQEIATRAKQTGTLVIDQDYVHSVLSEKTGIPVGPIDQTERDTLLNLEAKLHTRVIGQTEALEAIARAMRRARVGIQSAEKPIGSFLFLGPTGVGKTETAKALAYTFFGTEENMHRLDMSEFSGEDALVKLLGEGAIPGVLPTMLREHPYAVLLLDEFEKSSRAVHDIFLQILDEGKFSDSAGQIVNARNTIIIATSNAGSDLIIKTISQRQKLAALSEKIVDHLIAQGIYRPELLNRFDSIIIFEPLTRGEQGQVAGLLLTNLQQRLAERGYTLAITPEVISFVVEAGYSEEFGARPMQRVLQDVLEEKIATRILAGEIKPGDTITFTKADFSVV